MTIVRIAMCMGNAGISGWFDMKSIVSKCLTGIAISLGVLIALIILFILPPIGRHYYIPSMSMAPNLMPGDLIYSSNFGYTFSSDKLPSRGDIITFKPEAARQIFIKRTIGLPGDKVQMRRGRLYLNDVLIERKSKGTERLSHHYKNESYVYSLYEEQFSRDIYSFQILEKNDTERLDNTKKVTVPKGYVFVMGDNRDHSFDSRVAVYSGGAGIVPIENIIGEVKYILVPSKSCKNDEGLFCPKRNFFHKL